MADLARKGIPDEAGHVFGEALILLVQWKGGAEEPTVMLDGQLLRISMIFSRVANLRCADAGGAIFCSPTHEESQSAIPS
jgi:hypothetical protein